eukprot:CAMPEP_0178529626 /NCGR_PEP_ID=MMETSP0696-20121128/32430_1 /TAXON_ID=265572 /ORGANISM="Extubocellulus spinifer, Strain CCMP396" /LENGTH=133 /DNA_ID=CAMNT_0020161347 /DNA_START=225 /DNA_END=624 /DNA_ORIENTATION=+
MGRSPSTANNNKSKRGRIAVPAFYSTVGFILSICLQSTCSYVHRKLVLSYTTRPTGMPTVVPTGVPTTTPLAFLAASAELLSSADETICLQSTCSYVHRKLVLSYTTRPTGAPTAIPTGVPTAVPTVTPTGVP